MARILSIDYGKKRTGLAVTDPLQIIANGLATVSTSVLMDYLSEYFSREKVDLVVVGKPKQLNGKPSENWKRVKEFVSKFKDRFTKIPIIFYDERFTSALAHQVILDVGIKKKVRRENKGLVDEISATIILQGYLQSEKYKKELENIK